MRSEVTERRVREKMKEMDERRREDEGRRGQGRKKEESTYAMKMTLFPPFIMNSPLCVHVNERKLAWQSPVKGEIQVDD